MKLKFQPSLYVAREPGESAAAFNARILADPRLLPDQRTTLQQDSNAAFADLVRGIWLEQAPIVSRYEHEHGDCSPGP